jgi:hypothetical protein
MRGRLFFSPMRLLRIHVFSMDRAITITRNCVARASGLTASSSAAWSCQTTTSSKL